MQIAMLAADFSAGEADALRRAMAAWKRRGGLSPVPQAPGRQDGREGLHARVRRAHLQADRGLRRVRLPGEPRRRLRAARLRQQLDQVPPPRRVPVRPAQRAADGLLRAGAAGARRARARRRGAAGRRRGERVGEHARRRAGGATGRRRGWRGRPTRRGGSRGEGGSLRQPLRLGLNRVKGLAEDAGKRIVAARARGALRRQRGPGAPRPPRRARARRARRGRRAAEPHRPPPPGGVGGRRHRHAADRDAARDALARGAASSSPRRAKARRRSPTTAPSA